MNSLKLALFSLVAIALGFSSSAYAQSRGIVADFVMTESKQLTDGTQTEDTVVGEYALDSQGRMRIRVNQMELISDPVADTVWNVFIARGIASQSSAPASDGGGSNAATSGESWRADFPLPESNWPTAPEPTVEELATRTINGVECNGRRSRISLPAGTFGNTDALVIETETWTSEAFGFKIPVMVTIRDGTNNFSRRELRNVRASDFSATHFRPDERYRIVD